MEVTFIVLESKARVTKVFDNYRKCKAFVNKLKHSKKCRLVSYPDFRR